MNGNTKAYLDCIIIAAEVSDPHEAYLAITQDGRLQIENKIFDQEQSCYLIEKSEFLRNDLRFRYGGALNLLAA